MINPFPIIWITLSIISICILVHAFWKTIIEYERGNFVGGSKNHSGQHIWMIFGLLLLIFVFSVWFFWHWGIIHWWKVHFVEQWAWYILAFASIVFAYIGIHLNQEMDD